MTDSLRALAAAVFLRTAGAAASYAVMAFVYLASWVDPSRPWLLPPRELTLLVFFEFLFIHSTGLVRALRGERWIQVVLVAVYGLFALVMATQLSSPLVPLLFAWHLVSMAWGDLRRGGEAGPFWIRYGGTVVIFLFATFVAVLPWPDLGWGDVGGQGLPDKRGIIPVIAITYFTGRMAFEVWLGQVVPTGALDGMLRRLKQT